MSAVKIKVIDEEQSKETEPVEPAERQPVKKLAKSKTAKAVKTKKAAVKKPLKAAKKEPLSAESVKKEDVKSEIQSNLALAEEIIEAKKSSDSKKILAEIEPDNTAQSKKNQAVKVQEAKKPNLDSATKAPAAPEEKATKKPDSGNTAPGILDNPELDPVKRLIKQESKQEKGAVLEQAPRDSLSPQAGGGETLVGNVSKRSVKMYRNIAYFFVFLVMALLLSLSYFSFKKVEIVLVPNQERKSNNLIFDVYDESGSPGNNAAIPGAVRLMSIESAGEFESSGTEVIGKETVGEVTIYNNYTQNQPLVATTRLLTPDSKMFRIAETVNVPAGGSATVGIYADDPSPEMAIKPTKFMIPGLWAGLQDKIFAESKQDTVYRQKVKKFVQEADFDEAKKALRQQLLSDAKEKINQEYSDFSEIIYKIDENSILSDFDAELNKAAEKFTGTISADVVIVAFSGEKSAELSQAKFVSSLSENVEIIDFNTDNIIYTLNNYDVKAGNATINSTFEGKTSIKENSEIIKKEQIVGLKYEQLNVFLGQVEGISGYEVNFKPSFLPDFMRTVPKLVDKIEIKVKK